MTSKEKNSDSHGEIESDIYYLGITSLSFQKSIPLASPRGCVAGLLVELETKLVPRVGVPCCSRAQVSRRVQVGSWAQSPGRQPGPGPRSVGGARVQASSWLAAVHECIVCGICMGRVQERVAQATGVPRSQKQKKANSFV